MFEHKSQPLAPRERFLIRLARHFCWTLLIVGFSLAMGSCGYHFIAGLDWIDSFHNASMILTGMGPLNPMPSVPAKLFSSFYALYSGVAFLTMVATLLAPVAHRFMHRLHLEFEEEDEKDDGSESRESQDRRP
jgi:hypothetical protein